MFMNPPIGRFRYKVYSVRIQVRLKALFIIAAFPALSCVATATQPTPEVQLAAAEVKWAMNKPTVYEFSFKLLACCGIRVTGPGSEPYTFHVENGVGALTGVWTTRPRQATQGLDEYSSIDKIFAAIHKELAKRPYRFEIESDPTFGYPTRFYVKRFENAADDDYTLTVQGFSALARQ
jgi:hypothetical protein